MGVSEYGSIGVNPETPPPLHSDTPIPRHSVTPAWAWLQIIRLPNLLTVPGDPLAGYLLAAGIHVQMSRSLLLLMLSSLLLYMGGLVINDLVDIARDRVERPSRPLPSRRIKVGPANGVAAFLMLAGVIVAGFVGFRSLTVAVVLAACVFAYNLWLKDRIIWGPVSMGLCRALSLVLGATPVGYSTRPLMAATLSLTAYVAAVTYVARREAEQGPSGVARWFPAVVVLGAMCGMVHTTSVAGAAYARMALALFFAFSVAAFAAFRAPTRRSLPQAIGLMISALLGLQAAFCIGSNAGAVGLMAGLVLLLLWPVNRLLSRWIAAS